MILSKELPSTRTRTHTDTDTETERDKKPRIAGDLVKFVFMILLRLKSDW